MLNREPSSVGAPDLGQIRGSRSRPPKPKRGRSLRGARQPVDSEPDERATDERPGLAGTARPMVLRGRVHPAPGLEADLPIGGIGHGPGLGRRRPRRGISTDTLHPMAPWSPRGRPVGGGAVGSA